MLAFGSRQAGGSPELVDVLEFLDACQSVYPDESAFQTLKEADGKLVTDQVGQRLSRESKRSYYIPAKRFQPLI